MNSTIVGYAFALGLVGVVNPCGFPLLPAYLSLFATGERTGWQIRLVRGLRAGGCLAAGFLVAFMVLGVVAASAMSAVLAWIPWFMIVLGGALVVIGALTVGGRDLSLRLPPVRFRSGRGALAIVGFGASYALGSLSCSLPLFLAGVIGVFARTSFVSGFSAFVAYAVGMGIFVTAASVAASFTGRVDIRRLRPLAPVLPRIAGGVLVLAGAYLVYYWSHQLYAPTGRSDVIVDVEAVQSTVAGWISAHALPLGALLGGVIAVAFFALAMATSHANRRGRASSDV